MNLADYLSELLGQMDEVSVPGLGYFVRTRVSAYYNEKEARFYPPYHQVKFVAQPKDDDTFAQYVADKKNISLASSKYFAEKFISKLKEEASRGKYLFADLGLFYTDQGQLVFKANDKIAADPAFYGYPQINVYKLGQPLYPEHPKPAFAENQSAPAAAAPPAKVIEQPQYFEEEPEHKRRVNIWLVLLIILTVIALALFGVYKFYPAAFDKVKAVYNKVIGKKEDTVGPAYHNGIKADSTKKTVSGSSASAKTNPADTAKQSRFEVIASHSRFLAKENAAVANFRSLGLPNAHIVLDAPGPFIKVSVGTFPTYAKADSAMKALIQAGKINRSSEPLEIKPK